MVLNNLKFYGKKIPRSKSGGTMGFGKRAFCAKHAITHKIFQKKYPIFRGFGTQIFQVQL